MKISSMYGSSKYLKAADLNGEDKVLTIESVTEEEVGVERERKPVVFFRGMQKGLVLNKTNADRLAHRLGDETGAWRGANVELYSELVSYQGQKMEGLRVRVKSPASAPSDEMPF
jgi:hypothetical protein